MDLSQDLLKYPHSHSEQLLAATILSFIAYQSNALAPLIIFLISQYIEERNFSTRQSIVYLALIFTLKIVKIFLTMHEEYILKKIGSEAFSCICYSLTEKSLTHVEYKQNELSISQKSALAQYDASKLIEYPSIYMAVIF